MHQIQIAAFGLPDYVVKVPSAYRPRIQPHQLKELRQLKRKTGKPIAELVAEAIAGYLSAMRATPTGERGSGLMELPFTNEREGKGGERK